jgi:phospholipase C
VLGAFGNLFIGIGNAIRDGSEALGESVATAAGRFGRFLAWVGHAAGDLLWQLGMAIDCALHIVRGKKARPLGNLGKVDHFIVLMLENRSFDHMLGDHPGATGLDVRDRSDDPGDNNGLPYTRDAPDRLRRDPPHEFLSTRRQLWGSLETPSDPPEMKWFAQAYVEHEDFAADGDNGAPVMKGFSAKTAPIIHRLAREYAVCDHWFCSVPGPTFPNRFFLYAASSSGLASSQRTEYLAAEHVHFGVRFEHGSFFDRLRARCIPWRVYHGDLFPTVLSVSGMVREFADFTDNFQHLDSLALDLATADEDFPAFTLIEPSYGRFWDDYEGGTSQHPTDSVRAGERLIRDVYNAVRASPIWERTMLVIVYDEHGGFYDSQPPPRAVAPGDKPLHRDANREPTAQDFAYDWYGVRVPAIVISPRVPPNTVDSVERDHTSILKTLEERFNLEPLTQRDAHATSLANLVSLESPRVDAMNDL